MRDDQAYENAITAVERNEDGGVDDKALIDEVASLVDFDAAKERYSKAKRIVDKHRRPGSSDSDGQLAIPGLEPFAYEPKRLVSDGDGHSIEQAKARPHYVMAEAQRAQKNARHALEHADRKQRLANEFSLWAMRQLAKRRRAADITFDIFVRESGTWSAESAEPEPSQVDDAA